MNTGESLEYIYLNGIKFRGVGTESALGWEELVWSEEPKRSNDFSMPNIQDVDVGLVARCEVNFKYFTINDFMRFREIIKTRTFTAKFFNVDTGEWITRNMYCSGSERSKLHAFNMDLIGVVNFSVKLVATNNDLSVAGSTMTISYKANYDGVGTTTTDDFEETCTWSDEYTINDCEDFVKTGYHIKELNTKADGTGWTYLPNYSWTAFKNLTLYAIWEA